MRYRLQSLFNKCVMKGQRSQKLGFSFSWSLPCPLQGGKKKEFVSSLFYNDKTLAADFLPCKAYVTI